MHFLSLIPLSLFSLLLSHVSLRAGAVRFPVTARSVKRSVASPGNRLGRRASVGGSSTITNTHNAEYIANITLGGKAIPVMLDTGSSDLWVATAVPGAKDLGKSLTLSYAVGQAAGDVNAASLSFDNFTVPDQAFVLVTNTASFSTDISAQGYDGLIGLGPNSGSVIHQKISGDAGDCMLNRIFQQNLTSENYITMLLSRLEDPGETFKGEITVAELVPGYEKIAAQPQIPVESTVVLTSADQHWQILSDKDKGIVGPDGSVISTSSIVPKAPDGQLVAVFDSGYTFPQVPRAVSDAIYGRVQGAEFDVAEQLWLVPCTQMLNISFNFGGVNIPIHPLDTVSADFNVTDSNGKSMCVGTFQPITSAFSLLGSYDLILGMGFLRNTYTLFDYGDWVDESSIDTGKPFIQLLPITVPATAHTEFVKARLGGVDTTGAASQALVPASQAQHSPESEAEKKEHYEEQVISHWPYILLGCLLFVVLCVSLIVWRCCCRRSGKKGGKKGGFNKGSGGRSKGLEAGDGAGGSASQHGQSYAQLQDPASMVNLQEMRGSTNSYGSNPFGPDRASHDTYGPPPPRYSNHNQ
ncbi:acid protease [Athelia psychrophila]|uniref:Acid protease n=1 Tax=Athelia psychrophila TaxID=1759441 RepID=A0A165XLN4_9AGAM|nr:acid protease [Fibularhizoctonia sp. CBS 109695]